MVTCHVNLHQVSNLWKENTQGYETPIYFPYHQGYDVFMNGFVSRPKEKLAKSCLKPWRSWENSTFGVEVESGCLLFFEKDIFWTQKVLRGSKVSWLKRHDVLYRIVFVIILYVRVLSCLGSSWWTPWTPRFLVKYFQLSLFGIFPVKALIV